MSEALARRFIEALRRVEQEGQLDDLVALYQDDAVIGNVLEPQALKGRHGARSFWAMYRDTFQQVRSTFRNVIATEDAAALEWTSVAIARQGQSVTYSGVTLLEFRDGLISRSWAYFDTAGLGTQLRQPEIVPVDPGA